MAGCSYSCHVSLSLHPSTSPFVLLSSSSSSSSLSPHRKLKLKRLFRLVSSASPSDLPSAAFPSENVVGSSDGSRLPWVGPVPGDIAEIEAYCRIFRGTERLRDSLMETLCNPLTGECRVPDDYPSEDRPLLEDKLVSVLGCMLSLLNKGREEVVSGRSSIARSFRGVDGGEVSEDELPPLAVFRGEMKRCCESLHVALEDFLTPDDERSSDVWMKLQRLKNVCYDSGFPRGDACPCHMLFANWRPVSLSNTKDDGYPRDAEVAFCKGGQVTAEGLKWLIDKGFKTIVDLRSESIKDNFYQQALDDAILSGKIGLVKLPVEVRTAPTVEQVEKFASLVLDCSKKPIYLHSKEGVWRTCAMISRWRQFMSRNDAQPTSNLPSAYGDVTSMPLDGDRDMERSAVSEEKLITEEEGDALRKSLEKIYSSNGSHNGDSPSGDDDLYEFLDGPYIGQSASGGAVPVESIIQRSEHAKDFREIDPLTSQLPPKNVFSKAEMSKFLVSRKVSPSTYFARPPRKIVLQPDSRARPSQKGPSEDTVGSSSLSGVLDDTGVIGSFSRRNLSNKLSLSDSRISTTSHDSDSMLPSLRQNAREERVSSVRVYSSVGTDNSISKDSTSQSIKDQVGSTGSSSVVKEEDAELIDGDGDLCATATGVVRIQSRRKAEMFLVRTDGFSCTREKVTESSLAFTHPSTQQQMLMWKSMPRTVLLLKKLGPELMEEAKQVASFLYYQEEMNVLVEPDVHDIFARIPGFGFVQTFYSQDTSDLHERVDFVTCLGGDGVILHASNLFRGAVPPVVSFNLGSLGFLTSHKFQDYKQDLRQVIHGNSMVDGVYITLRMRLRCEIFRNGKAMLGKVFDVLNEVVVDRGSNPYLSKIECYEHDRLITKVQGDGVIVATPTGSTAYSTAAGGSMVHPSVPCMLFTPICPHSLSFRPVILPDSARLELKIPEDARSNAWVSFDGKRRQQLSRGDSVRISMSQHPLPTVNKSDQTGDWFRSLIRCLNWNERLDQKAL
ncbi:hypothetical protein MLD38_034049 [Melastoma candidum]|uniref:Uncharacterized protein n=1 Tax=Melastoma candidum TaxID=119954 RepID=A0ACB9M8P2_9MYRT|nr:hypothetical protein MLD38_034049 [Melastoma candidum]